MLEPTHGASPDSGRGNAGPMSGTSEFTEVQIQGLQARIAALETALTDLLPAPAPRPEEPSFEEALHRIKNIILDPGRFTWHQSLSYLQSLYSWTGTWIDVIVAEHRQEILDSPNPKE